MNDTTRRDFIVASTASTLVAAGAGIKAATAAETAKAGPGAYEPAFNPVPLPFSAKSLNGISERLIQSHWENNYTGAVKALNLVRGKLQASLADANLPAYLYTALKREQLLRTGSVVLHEHYFGNLGGNGKPDAEIRTRIAASFGTFDAWEKEFRTIGAGLGGGSGWALLGYNRHLKTLENYWMADHATGPVDVIPVLVMDMYEHAYQMDYGAAAAKYIDAFFTNINWEEVSRRLS